MKLVPGINALTEPYWNGAREGKLLYQRCTKCNNQWHPPLPRCPQCHSDAVEWIPAAGGGTLYSYSVVHHATHAAMADKVPYITAFVELDEGLRVLTNLRNCEPAKAQVGMRVKLFFETLTDEITLPQFEPA